MGDDPALPAGLRLVHLARTDAARAECIRRVHAGDPEGTLVWVDRPERPRGRAGRDWLLAADPGLHGALLLRPGLPSLECAQLGPVATVALGRAIASRARPMTELHYRWPNDVLLDGGKVAGVWLDGAGTADRLDWLVISWAVNTHEAHERLGFDAAALAREGRAEHIDHGELLQAVSRELVAAIATWDETGFDPILRSWRGRLTLGSAIHVATADGGTVAGTMEAIDAAGTLAVRADTATHHVTLARFFGLPEADP